MSLDSYGITFPDSTTQNTAGLPLTGGTVTGAVTFDGEAGASIAVNNYAGITTSIGDGIQLTDGVNNLEIYSGGITFPDNTTQTTAGLPLHASTNQTITSNGAGQGDTIFKNYVAIHNYLDIQKSPDPEIDGKLLLTHFGNEEEGILSRMSLDSYGITFPDASTQNTAGLPLTGGTMTGGITLTGEYDNPAGQIKFTDTGGSGFNTTYAGNGINFGTGNYWSWDEGIHVDSITVRGITLNEYGITYPDSSVQTTAFPPTGGTSSQYINGTGALITFPPLGDRYLTTSTSTLTIDNGNGKTMTVETGLSYSTQQDITVSYDAGHHIHGTIVSYNPTTGVMVFDANSHTGTGTYSNWEVNVGGVNGAILPVDGTAGQVLAKINSTNFNTEWISLGTMSTEPASAYLSTASAVANYQTISGMSAYLSTSAAASTYQTISGMSAYLSTSAASSTYLTQSNASSTYLTQSNASSTYQTQSGMSAYLSTASASANFIGTSAYATTAQAQAGTSTTTVVSPATLLDAKFFAGYKPLSMVYTWTSAVSGAGASTTVSGQVKIVFGPTSATGSAIAYIFNYNSSRGQQFASGADFTKRTTIGGRFIKTTTTADASTVFRFLLGKSVPSPSAGDLAVRGIGFRQVANGALELQVHNGTTLYNITSSFTPTANQSYDVVIVADAGTATMFVNGSSVATSANAPTALLGTNYGILEVETQNTATLTGSALNYSASDMFVQTNL